jgi:hypothetical protein
MFECGSPKNLADKRLIRIGTLTAGGRHGNRTRGSPVALWLGKKFDRSAQLSGGVSRLSSVTASA